jgi:hypothetical protein
MIYKRTIWSSVTFTFFGRSPRRRCRGIIQGSLKRVRPVMITAMTAILGLLGGMTVTLFLDRYLMPVLYRFGHR